MGCCNSDNSTTTLASAADVRDTVREGYSKIARTGSLSLATLAEPQSGGCCGSGKAPWSNEQLAEQLGYNAEQLAALPEGANMGLSCGNPTAIANLRPGQVVLDLGSGGGFDCFLAGPKVGPTGRVIGVDMTPDMLSKARRNIASYRKSTGLDNVEFRLGEIENLPIADKSVDVIISNCVINLSPDKPRVWQEIARVLKPGGTVAASDMALLKPLPEGVREMVQALVGCIAGAVIVDEYRAMVEASGLQDVQLKLKPSYVAALENLQDPLYQQIVAKLPAGATAKDYITSVDVTATKR